jgi:hypothetical protein
MVCVFFLLAVHFIAREFVTKSKDLGVRLRLCWRMFWRLILGGGGDASRGKRAHNISEPLAGYPERIHWDRDTSLHFSNAAKSM